MEMTGLQECLEVSVLSVPLPLGNVCNPRSKEVSLLICVNEVTTLEGQATPRAHRLYSGADFYYNLMYLCTYLETRIRFSTSIL